MSFGSFAVIPPALTAGLTLTPTPMVALFLIMRQVSYVRTLRQMAVMAFIPSQLLLISLFWVVTLFTTMFMPRLFAGKVTIIPLSLSQVTFGEPLVPTTQNISQLAYLTISVLAIFAFASMFESARLRHHAVRAIVLGGCFVVLTGVLDFLTSYLPIVSLLEPFRTATYALLTADGFVSGKRVVGLMPEASAYGGLVLTFLATIYFIGRSIEPGILRNRIIPILCGALALMLWLSTSSGAMVGFFVLCMAAVAEGVWRAGYAARSNPLRRGGGKFWIVNIGLIGLCLVILLNPQLLDPITNQVNVAVFQKTTTSSFEERSMWTTVSWQALIDTYGLGVGAGGTRASNGIVAIFSNTGFLGGILYLLFVAQTFLRRASRQDKMGQVLLAAVFWGFLPPFVANILSGTTPDFGLYNAFLFGFALAIERSSKRLSKPRNSNGRTPGQPRAYDRLPPSSDFGDPLVGYGKK